jgi:hypothetical protein
MTEVEFQIHVVDALARLDTQMKTLVGNGQPGRIDRVEMAVGRLNKIAWISGGIIIAVSAIIHFIFKY